MNIYKTQSQLYKVLMHPTRLAILDELREGEQCVCHMEAKFGLRQAYISQHLMILRDAGLVTDRRDGWNIFYSVSRPEIYKVIDDVRVFIDPIHATRAVPKDRRQVKLEINVPVHAQSAMQELSLRITMYLSWVLTKLKQESEGTVLIERFDFNDDAGQKREEACLIF